MQTEIPLPDLENERFIKIVRDNKRILYKIINSYCRDEEDKRDIEQEILINLWKSFRKYDGTVRLSTWIYRIALNVSISHHRKNHKKKALTTSLNESVFQLKDDHDAVEESKVNMTLLYQFIGNLEALEKAIMILYLDENSYKEISEILGISESNVGTKINRIKRKLKERFSNY